MKIRMLFLIVLCACSCGHPAVVDKHGYEGTSWNNTNGVPLLMQKLYSDDTSEREKTKQELLALAKTSSEARERVVHSLIEVVATPNPTGQGSMSVVPFEVWKDACELLGELKAIEAVGVLVEHSDRTNPIAGLSISRVPAVKALITIGDAAVPDLSKALFAGRPAVRGKAATALGEIGGHEAKEALQRASITEKDEEAAVYIQMSLRIVSSRDNKK